MGCKSHFHIFSQVLSRGNIVLQGSKKLKIEDHTGGKSFLQPLVFPAGTQQMELMELTVSLLAVTEGAFAFKLRVSSVMSPGVQVVAYAVLPSQGVIAHSAEFTTEKCFSHSVGLHLRLPHSPSGAGVP